MSPPSKKLRAFALVPLVLAGCGEDVDPIHIHVLPPPDTEKETRTLSGSEDTKYRGLDETIRVGIDLDRAIVQAQCETAEGWTLFPGTGAADGSFRIDGLPEETCFVRVDHFVTGDGALRQNEYFLTDADSLDLGTVTAGRGDIVFPTESAWVEVELDGLAAFAPDTDFFGIYGANARVVNYNGQDLPGFPEAGATSTTLTYDWMNVGQPLVDEAKGDRVLLTQWRVRDNDQGVQYFAPLRSAELEPFTTAEGETVQLAASLEEPPVVEYHLNWARSQFEALAADVHPEAGAVTWPVFVMRTAPAAVGDTWYPLAFGTEILGVQAAWEGTGDLDLGTFEVPNPFPEETLYDWYEVMFPVSIPWLYGMEAELHARIAVFNTEFPTADQPAVPLISPVRNIRVDGRSALDGLEGVGLQPRISWDPPSIGEATSYEIRIMEPGLGDMNFGGMFAAAAVFYVDGSVTELALPPDVLADWGIYTLHIRAVSQPGVDVTTTPRHRALPYAYAEAISEPFTP